MNVLHPRNWKMASKLIALSLVIGLGTLTVIGWLSLNRSSSALMDQQSRALDAVRTARQKHIEQYFAIIREQMFNFAQNRMITEATAGFSEAFASVPTELEWDTEPGTPTYKAVAGYYDDEFRPRLEEAKQPWRGTGKYVPQSDSGRMLQAMYIANNPNDVGDKLSLDRASDECLYNELHAVYHPRIRDFLESFGFYDIFLFDLEGNLVYSVFKETDYATNFLTGPYRATNFGDVYRSAMDATEPGELFLEDFRSYEPSYGAPASFISSPVFHDGEKVGVAVFQMPVDNINDVMGETAGLGETGETYLVGADFLMRSNNRFSEDSTILSQEVHTEAVSRAIEDGETGTMVNEAYNGAETLSAFAPINIEGLDWGIVAEISMAEVMGPAVSLRNQLGTVGLIVGVLIAMVAFFFSRTIVGPVRRLVESVNVMAQGDLSRRLKVTSSDEVGQLSQSFNEFAEKLSHMLRDINTGTGQIDTGSGKVASSSQMMANGASSQAANLEEISASLEEISSMTQMNADNAKQAADLSESAQLTADSGQEQMMQMLEAIDEIKRSSDEISKVIKVIDDIAFQTNLLALNAAIESEGAGEYGKRFAIVAEEVRKLAQRSTEASQETSSMIEASAHRAARAVEISKQVGTALDEIVTGTRHVNELVARIAGASQEQADGISQVNTGVSQLDRITQETASSSQNLATAAEQTATEVASLQRLVAQFNTGDVEGHHGTPPTAPPSNIHDPSNAFPLPGDAPAAPVLRPAASSTQATAPGVHPLSADDDEGFEDF